MWLNPAMLQAGMCQPAPGTCYEGMPGEEDRHTEELPSSHPECVSPAPSGAGPLGSYNDRHHPGQLGR